MKNLPFSKKWRRCAASNIAVTLYLECDEAWKRAKREVSRGWPVLLLPDNVELAQTFFPVRDLDVAIIDLAGVTHNRVEKIGIKIVQAGANSALYFGPNDRTVFFLPEKQT